MYDHSRPHRPFLSLIMACAMATGCASSGAYALLSDASIATVSDATPMNRTFEETRARENGPLDTDRPDFGAATTTVGKGQAVLETGYTFFHDHDGGVHFSAQTYLDAVLRAGVFSDWFELRLGQSFADIRTETAAVSGAQDLYLGVKVALSGQKRYRPESAVIIQSTVPTGAKALTAGRMLPGLVYLTSWEVSENRWFVSGATEIDRRVDDADGAYLQFAQVVNTKYVWTPRLRTFVEWVGLFPVGATEPGLGPEHYIHPGLTFFVTDNVQLDAHAFVGVNAHALGFFGGPGLSVRF